MKRWSRRTRDAVAALLDALGQLPPHAWLDAARCRLEGEQDRLFREEADPTAVATALRATMYATLLLHEEGLASAPVVQLAAAAYNTSIDAPHRVSTLAASRPLAATPAAIPLLRAAADRPTLRVVERLPFVRPALPEDEARGKLEAAGSAVAEDDDAPLGAPAPAEIAPAEIAGAPKPLVRRAEGAGEPVSDDDFCAGVVGACLDTMAGLARRREQQPFAGRARTEAAILARADAIACAGGRVVEHALAWWRRSLAAKDPTKTWAPVFALGVLGGADALDAVAYGLTQLALDDDARGAVAAEALAASPHPEISALGRELIASPHPIARAVGVDLLSRLGALDPAALRPHLVDANVPVLAAAVRAAARLDAQTAEPIFPIVKKWLRFPDPRVAWLTSRALLRWGDTEPCREVRDGGALASTLGAAAALEILVLAGGLADLDRMQAIVSRSATTVAHLSALARFGHAGSWAFLVHHLGNEDLADAADAALAVIFGDLVAPEARGDAAAWRSAIRAGKFERSVRYRRGQPYRASLVGAECTSGELSRDEIDKRLEELAVRFRAETRVDPARFTPDVAPALAEVAAEATRLGFGLRRGEWT